MSSRLRVLAGVALLLTAGCTATGGAAGRPVADGAQTSNAATSAPHPSSATTRSAAVAVSARTLPAPVSPSPARVPEGQVEVYGDCRSPSVAPREITLACADANEVLEGLHWTAWTSTRATAVGTLVYNDCTPSCAVGHFRRVPGTHVTLTSPARSAAGVLVWTKALLVPRFPGSAPGPQPLPTQPI